MKTVFLDTNVVIDFLAARADYIEDAAKIMTLAFEKEIKIFASALTFSTASYILAKHHANTAENIRLTIADFIKICNVTVVDEESVKFATEGVFDDFEDAMQYDSAKRINCEVIVTRNPDDFKNSEIAVMMPSEFLNSFV